MKHILVTGAAGFIGRWVMAGLYEKYGDDRVIAVDDLSGGGNLNGYKNGYVIDLRDPEYVEYLFRCFDISVVYHLAANARESASFFQPASVVSRNSGAFVNVITSALRHGHLERLIFTSSIAVYGHKDPPFREDMAPEPSDIYGLEKAKIESMICMLSVTYGFKYVIFRPHNLFGEHQSIWDPYRNVIGIWMNQIMRGESMTIFGDGLQVRAFTYIGDVIDAFIDASHYGDGFFNIGSDHHITILEACQMVSEAMGADQKVSYAGYRHREVYSAYSDHSRSIKEFGLSSTSESSIRKGIDKMSKWAKSIGPKEWLVGDPLEIKSDKIPENWR